jgi:hypothetical protein
MNKYEDGTYTSFNYSNGDVSTSKTITGDKTWPELLQEFVYFLEGIGYVGVRDRVAISNSGFTSEWYGPVFYPEQCQEVELSEKEPESVTDESEVTPEYLKGWTPWNGTYDSEVNDKLDPNLLVDVLFRNLESSRYSRVYEFDWSDEGNDYDIIGYRLVEQPE